jgi:outer membrane protein assembly factor BamB
MGRRVAVHVAAVAAVFSLLVAALLAYDFSRRQMKDPLAAPQIQDLRDALRAQPAADGLKEEIRALDEQLRREFFRERTFAVVGAGLLCGGIVVLLIAAKTAATLGRRLPAPEPLEAPQDFDARSWPLARWAVAGLAFLLADAAVVLTATLRSPLESAPLAASPGSPEGDNPASASSQPAPAPGPLALVPSPRPRPLPAAHYAPTEAEIRNVWPRFRGPGGSGISPYTNVPDQWDAASGKNILWKTAVLLPGNGSPVVCGRRLFLSGADAKRRQVYCFDTVSGALVWQRDVPATPQGSKTVKVNADTGFASPTVATDGRYVAAIFANGDLAAFDFDGKPAWSQGLGVPENPYGHGASPVVYEHLLLVPMDQETAESGRSKLLAFDLASGRKVWEQVRRVRSSWTTPVVFRDRGRDQVVTVADPWVIAYDPKDGKELWRAKAKCARGDVAPSPVFAAGVVYAGGTDSTPLCAIRTDGSGDVTTTHIVWQGEDNTPDTCSPLATESCVFVLTSEGTLTSYNAKSGEKMWEKDLGNLKFRSSPSLVGKRLYLLDESGKGWIIEPGQSECRQVGQTSLGEPCWASPAFQDGRIFIRGEKHLFCIGQPLAGAQR